MSRTRKILLSILVVFVLFTLGLVLMIDPIAKYFIQKYDVKYTGREIELANVNLHILTGNFALNELVIHELKSDSVFFTAEKIHGHISVAELFSGNYEISELIIDHPVGTVLEQKFTHNFDDLVELFKAPADSTEIKVKTHFRILSVKVNDGKFFYREDVTPIFYYIKNVNLACGEIRWDVDTMTTYFNFLSGIGAGEISGAITINLNNLDYNFNTLVKKFDLQIIEQYLDDLTNYGKFSANMDADLKAYGNFRDEQNITVSGTLAFNDFHFGKSVSDDYASFKTLLLDIHELSPINHIYEFDSLSLTEPYLKYEQYDNQDNIETMFGTKGSNIDVVQGDATKFNLVLEIADYLKVLAHNFFNSAYKINTLRIRDGNLKYCDYTQGSKFEASLSSLQIKADSISSNKHRVNFYLNTKILPYGDVSISTAINPRDSGDFEIQYNLNALPITMFNPYIAKQTSYNMDRGSIDASGHWAVNNSTIDSQNQLEIIDPRISYRVPKGDSRWLPAPVVMALVRERGNVISYSIPITGDLKNPKFHLKDAIIDMLKNIFVKPVTTAYRMNVKQVEQEIEKSEGISWRYRSTELSSSQEKFILKTIHYLNDNNRASIQIIPQNYISKEKESIMLFEAKKKYYIHAHQIPASNFDEKDSLKIEAMSIRDSSFTKYLNAQVKDPMLFTVQSKCIKLLGISFIENKYENLLKQRELKFLSFFRNHGIDNQIKLMKATSSIPFNGFSVYKIKYNSAIPDDLKEAYNDLEILDTKQPRKKFRSKRNEILK